MYYNDYWIIVMTNFRTCSLWANIVRFTDDSVMVLKSASTSYFISVVV